MRKSAPTIYRSGFSMLELSVVLTIIAVVTSMGMMAGLGALESARRAQTSNKLDVIETTLMSYRTTYNRLPCPTDPTLPNTNANYGVEAANPGSCTGGAPAISATFTDTTNNVVEGAVPFNTLGLPEEFMYDGWGRKFAYAVNYNVTATNAMSGESLAESCKITVNDAASTGGNRSTGAVYALVSYGPDGHGGYLRSGSRNNAGSTNTDELTNCHCSTATAAEATYAANYVMKDITQNPASSTDQFGDYVRFKERWQMVTTDDFMMTGGPVCTPGIRIDGTNSGDLTGMTLASVDVNGDGIPDLIIRAYGNSTVYVVFGTTKGFPNPLPLSSLNGNNGFSITSVPSNYNVTPVAIGDVDGDGVPDIIMGGAGSGQAGVWVFYGQKCGGTWGTACSPSYDLSAIYSGNQSCTAFWIIDSNDTGTTNINVGVGDINGDGYQDIIMADNQIAPSGKMSVVFGQPKTCPGTPTFPMTFDVETLNGTNGFYMTGVVGNNDPIATGDINGDDIPDLLIGDDHYTANAGGIYVIFGHKDPSHTYWPTMNNTAFTALNGTNGFILWESSGWGMRYWPQAIIIADFNGDGKADILLRTAYGHGTNYGCSDDASKLAMIIWGGGSWGNAVYDTDSLVAANRTTVFCGPRDGNADEDFRSIGSTDINGDGIADIFFSDSYYTTPGAYGDTYVYYGYTGVWPQLIDFELNAPNGTNGFIIENPYAEDLTSGISLTGLDMNGDGIQDLAFGISAGTTSGGSNAGYTYVLFGRRLAWTNPYPLSAIK